MLKGEGKIYSKGEHAGDLLYISKDIVDDSAYPFQHNKEASVEVQVEIDSVNQRLIISKKEK